MELRTRPTKEEIARLPVFEDLAIRQISLPATAAQFQKALEAIRKEGVVGFDTESKPTFTKDAPRDGPHVVQLALSDRAFVVQVGANPPIDFLRSVLESEEILKVGFGLKSDRGPLHHKLGITLAAGLELATPLRALRYRQALGVKAAVAVVLGRRLTKSKSMTTSNWARASLLPAQLLYAANDAYAALMVYRALEAQGLAGPRRVALDDVHGAADQSCDLDDLRSTAEEALEAGDLVQAWTMQHLAVLLGADLTKSTLTAHHDGGSRDGNFYDSDFGGALYVDGDEGLVLPTIDVDQNRLANERANAHFSRLGKIRPAGKG